MFFCFILISKIDKEHKNLTAIKFSHISIKIITLFPDKFIQVFTQAVVLTTGDKENPSANSELILGHEMHSLLLKVKLLKHKLKWNIFVLNTNSHLKMSFSQKGNIILSTEIASNWIFHFTQIFILLSGF